MPSDDDHDWVTVAVSWSATRDVCRICGADRLHNHNNGARYKLPTTTDLPCSVRAEMTRSHRFYVPGDLRNTISCHIECVDCGEEASWVLVNPPRGSEAYRRQININGTHVLRYTYPIAKCSTIRMQKALG